MRISGGQARGRAFSKRVAPGVRPPLGRLRQSIFSILGERIEGSRVLDLFAGSGVFGFEALSRGAREVVFVESDGKAVDRLERSAGELGVGRSARVVRCDALADVLGDVVRPPSGGALSFDVVFVDPPFALFDDEREVRRLSESLERLLGGGLLSPDAVVVVRWPRNFSSELRRAPNRVRHYGRSTVAFFEARTRP